MDYDITPLEIVKYFPQILKLELSREESYGSRMKSVSPMTKTSKVFKGVPYTTGR